MRVEERDGGREGERGWGDGVRKMNMSKGEGREIFAVCG